MQAQEKVGEKPNNIESHSYLPKIDTKCILVVNRIQKKRIQVFNLVSNYNETKFNSLPHWLGIWKIKKLKI